MVLWSSCSPPPRTWKETHDPGHLFSNCNLVVIDGLSSHPSYPLVLHQKIHIMKNNVSILDLYQSPASKLQCQNILIQMTIPVDSVKLVFLNTIAGNEKLLHLYFREISFLNPSIRKLPSNIEIEGSLESADIWFQHSSTKASQKIRPDKRKSCQYRIIANDSTNNPQTILDTHFESNSLTKINGSFLYLVLTWANNVHHNSSFKIIHLKVNSPVKVEL